MVTSKNTTIVLFDGVCNLCNSLVIFLIKRDHKKRLFFTPLQSQKGQELLASNQLKTTNFDSFVLYMNGKVYQKSNAGIRVLASLGYLWKSLLILLIIPRPIRDYVYTLIARNRYRWWGKKDSCMIPTPALKNRFI